MQYPEFTLYHLLVNAVERAPYKEAVVDGSRHFTYEQLWGQASRLAGALQELGLRRGERVGIYLPKSWEAVVSLFAVAGAGGAFVVIGPTLKEQQVNHILANCSVRMLITDPTMVQGFSLQQVALTLFTGPRCPEAPWSSRSLTLAEAMNGSQPTVTTTPANERDLATIIYTSGSTGLPKGIMISHHNLVAGAQIVSTYLQNTPDDRVIAVLPLNFDYGLNQITTMVRVGGTAVLQHSLLPGDILRTLRQEAITGMAGIPPVWTLLLQARRSLEREPLAHLRYITNSGGMISKRNLDLLQQVLPGTRIYLMYGLTEAFRATYLPPEEVHRGPACIGRAIPNTDIWVVDKDGKEVAPGEQGELIQRGPTVALGYWGDKEHTESVYRPNPFAPQELRETDLVVYSGDVVRRGEDGFLYFVGRRDELIKTQGYRVSPGEVEEILTSIPCVLEAVAFGRPDPVLGQKIVAVVSLRDGATCGAEYIRESFSAKAPYYLVPQELHILPELPRTSTGKIDRSLLKHDIPRV